MFGLITKPLNRVWRRTFGRREWLKEKDIDTKRDLLGEKLVQLLDVAAANSVDFDDLTVFCTHSSEGFYVGNPKLRDPDQIAVVRIREYPVVKEALTMLQTNNLNTTSTVNAAIDELVGEIFRQVYGRNLLGG